MTDELVDSVADRIEALIGPVVGSPEYLADPVKLARAEKRRRDHAVSLAGIAIEAMQPAIREAELRGMKRMQDRVLMVLGGYRDGMSAEAVKAFQDISLGGSDG